MAQRAVYIGRFIHSKNIQELDIFENRIIGVDEHGKIGFIGGDQSQLDKLLRQHGWDRATVQLVETKDSQFFFPGFIDTHIHASQYPNAGIFGKSTLLDWLNTYTFPLESSLSDLKKARTVYTRCIARTLSHGTTTAAYYATIDVGSTNLLTDICHAAGQRAFIGRCCMDTLSPEYYRDASPDRAIEDTKATIAHINALSPPSSSSPSSATPSNLLTPIITPRFAPSCSSDLLHKLGALMHETGLPAQTHMSENLAEGELVARLFPECDSYAAVYDTHGLLGPRTVLAHVVHLSEAERSLLQARDAKVSHCPTSNSALTSGAARVRWLLDGGVTVGLGTDVSGGYSASMLEAVRQAALVSRHVAYREQDDAAKLSLEEALYLATRGGAKVLGLEDHVGGFDVGKDWDAQLVSLGPIVSEPIVSDSSVDVDVGSDKGLVDVFGWETWEDRVAKWVYGGDDRNTLAVWVKGRLVHSKLGDQTDT
ncbi:MAG: hypothetical protein M1825_002194 [Sarcosagium campestre]|nr:MAG: hypothetical protein M1825_002194 [Sarcosagium campestre]